MRKEKPDRNRKLAQQLRRDAKREVERCDANLPGDCPEARRFAIVLRGIADALDDDGDEIGEAPALEAQPPASETAPSGAAADTSQPDTQGKASPADPDAKRD
jgi:hypothetical protein